MACWRFFGHVLRLPREAPARLALEWYLNVSCYKKNARRVGSAATWRSLSFVGEQGLQTADDLNKLRATDQGNLLLVVTLY